MSGRKQHFIPQAVQRGFAAGKGGKATQVYVYPKGRPPYRSSTEGVAAQRDFYSQPSDEETLDDRITAYEGAVLAPAIAALRESQPGPIDSHAAAAVVVHLSIRSAFIRGTFSTAAQELLTHLAEALSSEEATRALLGIDSVDPESMATRSIEEELQKLLPAGFAENERVFISKLARFRAREKFAQMHPDLAATALAQFGGLLDRMPEIVLSGHSKALEQGLVPQQRVERLKAMNWQVLNAPEDGHFVLPDCLALGSKLSDLSELEPYALLGDDELKGVVMPVSATKVLVGSAGEPQLDVTQLNDAFARCSMDFVISSQEDAGTRSAAALIGTSVNRLVGELIDETFAPPRESPAPDTRASTGSANVAVKFEPLGRKNGKSQAVVRNLLFVPELESGMELVEYVVVTDSVAQSLRRRGLKLAGIAEQSVTPGFCHLIESPSGLKCQLFVPTKLVDAVVRSTPAAAAASRLIRHQAGRATYYAHLMRSVPAAVWTKPMSMLLREGLRSSHRIASHYFGARLSLEGELSGREVNESVSFWHQCMEACAKEIANARVHFLQSNDANVALPHAWTHAELLLTATAAVCATVPSPLERLLEAIETSPALANAGLGEWLVLFSRDLKRNFDMRQNWSEDQELQLLAGHLERILWSFGIVLADHGATEIWMISLFDERLEAVRTMLRA